MAFAHNQSCIKSTGVGGLLNLRAGKLPVRPREQRAPSNVGSGSFVLASAVLIYFACLYYFRISPAAARQNDFGVYYVWAYAARHGVNPYVSVNSISLAKRLGLHATKANYPPFFILILEPLSWLPFAAAFWLWSILNLVLLLVAVQLLVSGLGTFQRRVFFGAAALLYAPVTDAVYWSQAEPVILFLLAISMRALEDGRSRRCGIAIGLAALCKVHPIFLLGYFLLSRRWVTVAYAAMTVLAGIVLSVAAFGMEYQIAFLRAAWSYGGDLFLPYTMNVSLDAMSSRVVSLFAGHESEGQIARLSLAILLKCLLAALTVWATLIARRRGVDRLAFGLWVAAVVLLTPVIWLHHLINLLIPLAQLTQASNTNRIAFRVGALSYCFAELALPVHWVRAYMWPAYALSTQFAIGSATLAAVLFALVGAFWLCAANSEANKSGNS
jgi:hypothetical protein